MSQTPSSPVIERATPGSAAFKSRPFRVKLRGSILALIRLPNRREVRAKVNMISTTGGLLNVEKPLDEKLQVELIFHLGETTVREKAEMLFPMWATQGWLQPFRFIDLSESNKATLETNLQVFVKRTQSATQL
jgi:hypothetical protein